MAAQVGEPDRAIAALQKLLAIPYEGALAVNPPLTPALLRLDPMFDPLRNDPPLPKTRFHYTERGGQISRRDHVNNLAAERTAAPDHGNSVAG